jgi:hypothetical protein
MGRLRDLVKFVQAQREDARAWNAEMDEELAKRARPDSESERIEWFREAVEVVRRKRSAD